MNIAIITAEYNQELTSAMRTMAKNKLNELEANTVKEVSVPGVLDMPLITKQLLQKDDIDGIIVVGVVIKGDSDHDQIVANHAVSKLMDLEMQYGKPIGFGIIGPGISKEKAKDRADSYAVHAAETVVAQIKNINELK
jgi:6,7-dimethyl-8-ribityllumazine synthase